MDADLQYLNDLENRVLRHGGLGFMERRAFAAAMEEIRDFVREQGRLPDERFPGDEDESLLALRLMTFRARHPTADVVPFRRP